MIYYALPLTLVGISYAAVVTAYKSTKRRWVWKALAIGLPIALIVDIVPGNLELEKICTNEAGVHVLKQVHGPTMVAVDKHSGIRVVLELLQHMPEVEKVLLEEEARDMQLDPQAYRFRFSESDNPACLPHSFDQMPQDLCLIAESIPGLTAQYRASWRLAAEDEIEPYRDWRNWRTPVSQFFVLDRESNDILGVARTFQRTRNWSWSGMSVVIPMTFLAPSVSPGNNGGLKCPTEPISDLKDRLFQTVFQSYPQ